MAKARKGEAAKARTKGPYAQAATLPEARATTAQGRSREPEGGQVGPPKLLFVIKDSGLDLEDLADVTEAIRQWLRNDEVEALVLNLPGADARIVAKTLDGSVLRDADTISLKVRLKDGKTEKAEARTQVVLKRT
jgi:hypothetical protein